MFFVAAATVSVLTVPVLGWLRLCRDWIHRLLGDQPTGLNRPDMAGAFLFALASLALALAAAHFARHWYLAWRLLRTHARRSRERALFAPDSRVDYLEVDDQEPFAFAVGILRPRIILSTALVDMLDRSELQALLRHEKSHVRHRDTLRYLVAASLSRAFFFVPLVPALASQIKLAAELRADAEADDERALGTALVKLMEIRWTVTAAVPSGSSDVLARLERLVDPSSSEDHLVIGTRNVVITVMVLGALALGALEFGNAHAFAAHSANARCIL